MRPMTSDTQKALELIIPIAAALDIEVHADGSLLYCNGQAIGIGCNSTYATVNEFIGYAFLRMCRREYRFKEGISEAKELVEAIKRYWYSEYQMKQLKDVLEGKEDAGSGNP